MALGDLYVLRAQYQMLGSPMENTFFYEQTLGSGGADVLARSFEIQLVPEFALIQSSSVTWEQITVINLDDSADFFTEGVVQVGNQAGEALPPYAAWGFTRFSTDRKIRSGGLRIGGVSEGSQDGGSATAAQIILLTAFEPLVAADVSNVAVTNTWGTRLHTDGNLATGGTPLTIPVASILYRRLTTQSSRKFS